MGMPGTIVGQELALRELETLSGSQEGGRFLLFTGPRGVGKGSAARWFARLLLCDDPPAPGRGCGTCPACTGKEHPDLLCTTPPREGEKVGIEAIREILAILSYPPFRARFRVWILDPMEELTLQAQEALLRTLEEPPSPLWVLGVTHAGERLPLTLRSRAVRIPFRRLSPEALLAIHPHLPQELLALGSVDRLEELKGSFPPLYRHWQELLRREPYDPQASSQFARKCEGFPGGFKGFLETLLLLHSNVARSGEAHYHEGSLLAWVEEGELLLKAIQDLELHVNPGFVAESLIRGVRRIEKQKGSSALKGT